MAVRRSSVTYREPLPGRRVNMGTEFNHEGTRYAVRYSRFPDGRLAEVFIDASKAGTHMNVIARDAAVVLSLALQYGTPVAQLRDALTRLPSGEHAGPIGVLLELIESGPVVTCEGEAPRPALVRPQGPVE
jgi:hypothetical protein